MERYGEELIESERRRGKRRIVEKRRRVERIGEERIVERSGEDWRGE